MYGQYWISPHRNGRSTWRVNCGDGPQNRYSISRERLPWLLPQVQYRLLNVFIHSCQMVSPRFLTFVLAQWALVHAQDVITNDSFFYGQSPEVSPPRGTGSGNWSAAYSKARAFVAQLSLDEKLNFTAGITIANGCSGNIAPVERLGFPGLCLQDAGNGVRGTDFVNGYPSGLHVGARYGAQCMSVRALLMEPAGTKSWLTHEDTTWPMNFEPKVSMSSWVL